MSHLKLSAKLISSVFALGYVTSLVGSVSTPTECADRPEDWLGKSMKRSFPVHVVAVIVQRDPSGDDLYQTVRVERSKEGKTHHVVLQPLRLQGMESVDDGDRMQMFWPDQNIMIDQVAPHHMEDDAALRLKLAKANYEITFGESLKVAGRDAKCVVATPREPRLETRRFYLDSQTGYPLRMEIVPPGQSRKLVYDTKDIKFPASLDSDRFRMKPLGSARKLTYDPPEKLRPSDVKRRLGFEPILPEKMPMGFKMQEMQLTNSDNWRALAIRLTDGLVKATVYQWRAADNVKVRSLENGTSGSAGALRILVVSDMPLELRRELLRAFSRTGDLTWTQPTPMSSVILDWDLGRRILTDQTVGEPASRPDKLYDLLPPRTEAETGSRPERLAGR